MADPLTIGFAIVIAIAICLRCAVVLRYGHTRRDDDVGAFEKDVEWQLQHELSDAIEASSSNGSVTENEMQETTPLLLSSPEIVPHIKFADPQSAPGSWHDFKAYSQAELQRMPTATASPLYLSAGLTYHLDHQTNVPSPLAQHGFQYDSPLPMTELAIRDDEPIFVNPKQFHRILKRRAARQVLEDYLRTHLHRRDFDLRNERARRPRAASDRLLTLAEVEGMNGGIVVA